MTKQLHRLIAPLLAALLLSGCGFQLRGSSAPDLGGSLGPTQISGLPDYHPMYRAVADALRNAGSEVSPGAANRLVLSNYRSDRRVMSVDSSHKAAEYEIREAVSYALRRGSDTPAAPQELSVRRHLSESSNILSGSREEQLLREEMRRELAQRLISRLNAQH